MKLSILFYMFEIYCTTSIFIKIYIIGLNRSEVAGILNFYTFFEIVADLSLYLWFDFGITALDNVSLYYYK